MKKKTVSLSLTEVEAGVLFEALEAAQSVVHALTAADAPAPLSFVEMEGLKDRLLARFPIGGQRLRYPELARQEVYKLVAKKFRARR